MKRREFIRLVGAAGVSAASGAFAAQAQRMRRLGVLTALAETDPENQARLASFREALEKLGWVDGRNLHIDYRFAAGSADQYQPLARELVALNPDVILVSTGPATAAMQGETRSIPIIFTTTSDPIGAGFVASLAKPGGNITGFLLYEASVIGKWLSLLKELAPLVTRVAVVGNPRTTPFDYYLREAQTIATTVGLELTPLRVGNAADIERSLNAFADSPSGGFVVLADAMLNNNRTLIIGLAARHHLPTIYGLRVFVTDGGLMSYDTDRLDQFRGAAAYVDRILRGAKPAELPVQAPTKYETVINLKTARALRLSVPPGLLVAADEVIE
jgi:putative ABC transport system substrate-binding protein